VWALQATQTNGNGTVAFDVYVDTPETNPSLPATTAYSLQWCTGGLGLNITEVDLDLVRMFVNPDARGLYVWRAVYEPSDGKAILTGSSVGVAAAVPIDPQVTLKAVHAGRSRRVTLSGFVTAVSTPLAGVKVQVFVGRQKRIALTRPRATVRTKTDGSFRVTLPLGAGHGWYARVRAATPYLDITSSGCAAAQDTLAAKGCVDATLSPFAVTSHPALRVA
jgi:hypothetical protein